jgi:hypothetical protein
VDASSGEECLEVSHAASGDELGALGIGASYAASKLMDSGDHHFSS